MSKVNELALKLYVAYYIRLGVLLDKIGYKKGK